MNDCCSHPATEREALLRKAYGRPCLACPQKAFPFVCLDFENPDRIPCPLSHIHDSRALFSSADIAFKLR